MIKSHMHPLIYGIQHAFVTLSYSHSYPSVVITSPFKDIMGKFYGLILMVEGLDKWETNYSKTWDKPIRIHDTVGNM